MDKETFELATRTIQWHEAKLSHLRKMQEVCEDGLKIQLGDSNDEDSQQLELTGREALIFRLGMEAAMTELGTLPFTLSQSDDDEQVDG